jgi:hypothetical protein
MLFALLFLLVSVVPSGPTYYVICDPLVVGGFRRSCLLHVMR